MQNLLGTLIGKLIRLTLILRRGGGHALPGLIIEKLFPNYTASMLSRLPEGIVLVTGTNGKTTTTKMLVEVLKANGRKVITNTTGSNLIRGINSSLIKNASLSGNLAFDVAVLEVDEAAVRPLISKIKPNWVVALNVSRDQLDRYGEVDTIARHIGVAMKASIEGIVVNADDPHLLKISQEVASEKQPLVFYFGATESLHKFFPSDFELAAVSEPSTTVSIKRPKIAVELMAFEDQKVSYKIQERIYSAEFKLRGQHNFLNAAAALTLAAQLLPQAQIDKLISQLAQVSIAFGRGEIYRLKNGAVVELVLVKNPASFRQALASYATAANSLMIAINDNIADGRDVSWLWDVDFNPLAGRTVAVTSGRRAADMALRLSYDDVKVGVIEPDLYKALKILSEQNGSKIIMATYTAMLSLYSYLNKKAVKLP